MTSSDAETDSKPIIIIIHSINPVCVILTLTVTKLTSINFNESFLNTAY